MNEQYESEIRKALAHYPPKDAYEYSWAVEAVRALLEEVDRLRAAHARLASLHLRLVDAVKDALFQRYDTDAGHVVPDHIIDTLREALKEDKP
jgi:hypothetical protein